MTLTLLTSTNPKTVTSATAETGVSISSLASGLNATIKIAVYGLDTGDTAVIQIDDSVNAFTNWVTQSSFPVVGPIGATGETGEEGDDEGESTGFAANPKYFTLHWYDAPAIRWGTSSAVLRVNVSSLTGSSPHLTYTAWFEY